MTELPFDTASLGVVLSQHVQMSIAGERQLYAEARRVLAPGGRLALWDVSGGAGGPLRLFPAEAANLEHNLAEDRPD